MPRMNVDLTGIEPSTPVRKALPAGEYLCMVKQANVVPFKNVTGNRLSVEFLVLTEGDGKGSVLWESFNLEHPKEIVAKIAKEQLVGLSEALGLSPDFLRTDGTEALLRRQVVAHVSRELADNPQYGDFEGFDNSIKRYSPAAAGEVAQPPVAAAPPPPAPAQGGAELAEADIPF